MVEVNPTRESDPVGFWLNRVSPVSRRTYSGHLKLFRNWLNQQEGFEASTPESLVKRQREAKDDAEFVILDRLQTWVDQLDRTLAGKRIAYQAVRSFFLHNRCALPKDVFKIKSEKRATQSKMTLNDLHRLASAANLRDRSIILFKFQSLLDTKRLSYVDLNCAQDVVRQIKNGEKPVMLTLPGRKGNTQEFHTFIGKDATEALTEYFEKERGWPKTNEPIWFGKRRFDKKEGDRKSIRQPLKPVTLRSMWISNCRRAGLITHQRGGKDTRYGYGAHELRDLAKTTLHLHGKQDGLDLDCVKYWLGHTVDPLGYDKFHKDTEYLKTQYLIAERYLDILSSPIQSSDKLQDERLRFLEGAFDKLMDAIDRQDWASLDTIRQARQQSKVKE